MEPPPRRPRRPWLRWALSAAALLYKLKFLLVAASILLSLLVYGLAFGWAFGLGLVVLLGLHELGHALAIRRRGLAATLPIFIPFLGAVIGLRQTPRDAAEEAYIAVAGPLFGVGASYLAWYAFARLHLPILAVIAATGMLIHIFNLLPIVPLDGGRTVAFLRWKAWGPGLVALVLVLFYNPLQHSFRMPDLFTIIILAFILSQFAGRLRAGTPAGYDAIPARAKWTYGLLWLGLLAASVIGLLALHIPV